MRALGTMTCVRIRIHVYTTRPCPAPQKLIHVLRESQPAAGPRRLLMKRKRHTPEQIIRKFCDAEKLRSDGQSIGRVCQKLQVSVQVFHR